MLFSEETHIGTIEIHIHDSNCLTAKSTNSGITIRSIPIYFSIDMTLREGEWVNRSRSGAYNFHYRRLDYHKAKWQLSDSQREIINNAVQNSIKEVLKNNPDVFKKVEIINVSHEIETTKEIIQSLQAQIENQRDILVKLYAQLNKLNVE